jgi:hypothetical protein
MSSARRDCPAARYALLVGSGLAGDISGGEQHRQVGLEALADLLLQEKLVHGAESIMAEGAG